MYQGLADGDGIITYSDPLPILSAPGDTTTTTLHLGGGYAGQPVISPTESAGYEGVSTVNAPSTPIATQVGLWLSNHALLAGVGIAALLLMKGGGRRR